MCIVCVFWKGGGCKKKRFSFLGGVLHALGQFPPQMAGRVRMADFKRAKKEQAALNKRKACGDADSSDGSSDSSSVSSSGGSVASGDSGGSGGGSGGGGGGGKRGGKRGGKLRAAAERKATRAARAEAKAEAQQAKSDARAQHKRERERAIAEGREARRIAAGAERERKAAAADAREALREFKLDAKHKQQLRAFEDARERSAAAEARRQSRRMELWWAEVISDAQSGSREPLREIERFETSSYRRFLPKEVLMIEWDKENARELEQKLLRHVRQLEGARQGVADTSTPVQQRTLRALLASQSAERRAWEADLAERRPGAMAAVLAREQQGKLQEERRQREILAVYEREEAEEALRLQQKRQVQQQQQQQQEREWEKMRQLGREQKLAHLQQQQQQRHWQELQQRQRQVQEQQLEKQQQEQGLVEWLRQQQQQRLAAVPPQPPPPPPLQQRRPLGAASAYALPLAFAEASAVRYGGEGAPAQGGWQQQLPPAAPLALGGGGVVPKAPRRVVRLSPNP